MSRDTVGGCLGDIVAFLAVSASRGRLVASSSPGSRPGPCGWPAASLDFGWGGVGRDRDAAGGVAAVCLGGPGVARGAVVPGRVQDQLAEQLTGVAVDDADVQVVHEQTDWGVAKAGAEPDVVQPAVVAQGD